MTRFIKLIRLIIFFIYQNHKDGHLHRWRLVNIINLQNLTGILFFHTNTKQENMTSERFEATKRITKTDITCRFEIGCHNTLIYRHFDLTNIKNVNQNDNEQLIYYS